MIQLDGGAAAGRRVSVLHRAFLMVQSPAASCSSAAAHALQFEGSLGSSWSCLSQLTFLETGALSRNHNIDNMSHFQVQMFVSLALHIFP